MLLSELAGANGTPERVDTPEQVDRAERVDIAGLAADSREVRPGYLFAALAGSRADGGAFIDDAIRHGAVAVLARPGIELEGRPVHLLTDINPRRRFALMAARFFGRQPEVAVAVTGTNGKSSVASFTRQIWRRLGHNAASVGTLGVHGPDIDEPTSLTTPDPVTLYRTLTDLAGRGVDHVAVEASSHGLDQYRLDGLRLSAAAFTNLTRDHLDYHASVEDYLYAKLRLFGEVMAPGGVAVLNAESVYFREAEALCWARGHRIISVGLTRGDLRLTERKPLVNGQRLRVFYGGRDYPVILPLIGDFQAKNALIAAALVIACGDDPARALSTLPQLAGVPGRMQLVTKHPSGAPVFVDFAHTPHALETVLRNLRAHTMGRIVLVFGCGGDRDAGKRPLMGAVAAKLADRVIVTDDNPRSEDPARIRAEILAACPDAEEFDDRQAAIFAAMRDLKARDAVVIAGKGHERGQLVAGKVQPFDDTDQARRAVAAVGAQAND